MGFVSADPAGCFLAHHDPQNASLSPVPDIREIDFQQSIMTMLSAFVC
jgi:hypothetical protein